MTKLYLHDGHNYVRENKNREKHGKIWLFLGIEVMTYISIFLYFINCYLYNSNPIIWGILHI